jgi:hypothetical protein
MRLDGKDENIDSLCFVNDQVSVAQDKYNATYMTEGFGRVHQVEVSGKFGKNRISCHRCSTSRRSRNLGTKMKVCSNFKCLGSVINKTGTSQEDICNKMRNG